MLNVECSMLNVEWIGTQYFHSAIRLTPEEYRSTLEELVITGGER
jgi:hypothetical protein